MIEFEADRRGGVNLRIDRADARAWLDAMGEGVFDLAALRDGRAYALHLQPSVREWIRIQAAGCTIAVDEDSLQYLRDSLEAFLRLGHISPAELWHMPDAKSGRERRVHLLQGASGATVPPR